MRPGSIRWGRIFAAACGAFIVFLTALFLWYYVAVFLPEQASVRDRAQGEAVETKLRAKHCGGGEFANEAVRKFCIGK